jgi:aconitate decarboxylase
LKYENVPDEVRERAKYLILDGIGCGIVGARVPWSKAAFDAMSGFEEPGSHHVIGYDEKFSPQVAAVLNGTFIQACELDDYHSVAPLHSLSIILPALFAAAGCNGVDSSGKNLLLAAIAGFETGPRAGLALHGGEMLTKGWHSGPVFGAPASSAAVSKLCNLTADAIESAIGIACTQACGLMAAQYEGSVKRMQHAFAARNGLLGAMLAKGGYEGIKKIFERPYGGYLAMFSLGSQFEPRYKLDEITHELGVRWHTNTEIRVKLHACVGGCHGLIELLDSLQKKHPELLDPTCGADLAKIESISIGLSNPIYHHDGWAPEVRPLTTTGAQMNAAYIAATKLIDGQVLLRQFADSQLDRDDVWELTHKCSCFHDPQFDQRNKGVGASVVIKMNNGEVIQGSLDAPKGYSPPVSNQEILEKFRKLTDGIIDIARRDAIETMVLDLENLSSVSTLLGQLRGEVGNSLA